MSAANLKGRPQISRGALGVYKAFS